jgi:Holliday junction resolvase RusA-like endonuclease
MKLWIDYMPPNWNEYINMERVNKYKANNLKQKEKQLIKYLFNGKRYDGKYPVEIVLKPHFSAYRQDLDNFRYKGLLDGLVSAGVIKNDNLKHIQKITIDPVFDDVQGVEIEIKEL